MGNKIPIGIIGISSFYSTVEQFLSTMLPRKKRKKRGNTGYHFILDWLGWARRWYGRIDGMDVWIGKKASGTAERL